MLARVRPTDFLSPSTPAHRAAFRKLSCRREVVRGWGKALAPSPEAVGSFRLCQRGHRRPRDSAQAARAGSASNPTCRDPGTRPACTGVPRPPLARRRPPPQVTQRRLCPPPFLPRFCSPQAGPRGVFGVRPGIFWPGIFQVCPGPWMRCVQGQDSEWGAGKTWPKSRSLDWSQHPGEDEESRVEHPA